MRDAGVPVIVARHVYQASGRASPDGQSSVIVALNGIHVEICRNDRRELVPDGVVSAVWMTASVALSAGELLSAGRSGIQRFRSGARGILHISEGKRGDVDSICEIVVGWRRSGDLKSHRLRLTPAGRSIEDSDVVGASEGAE